MTRVLFMGTPDFAVPTLRALCEKADGWEVVGVVTREDKPAGRGRRLTPPPVKVYAQTRALPILQPKGVKKEKVQGDLRGLRPDLIVVAAYGRILPPAVLELPALGCVNVHASLLPRHRGASPVAHAILAGDEETGVSIMRMDAGLDTGPVYARATLPIPADATMGTLTDALASLGAVTLLEVLPHILDESLSPEPQDDSAATFAPLLAKEDGHLDFTRPANLLERKVRAFSPWPGCFARKDEIRVGIARASANPQTEGEPGVVVTADKKGVVVACGSGGLCLEEVKPAGKKSMPAGAWVAGRGVRVGDRLT